LVAGGDLTGVRLQSPSLRATWPLDICPQGLPGEHSHIALRMVAADGVRDVAAGDDMQKLRDGNNGAIVTAEVSTGGAATGAKDAIIPSGRQYSVSGGYELFPLDPLPLITDEALEALVTNGAASGARALVAVLLANGVISPVSGEMRTIKGTTTLTVTANAWSSGPIDLAQDLPVGNYRLVGAKVVGGDTAGVFRFIPVGGGWRPGGLISRYYTDETIAWQRRGGLGVWFDFAHNRVPRLEVLEIAAVDNPDVYLDLIRLS